MRMTPLSQFNFFNFQSFVLYSAEPTVHCLVLASLARWCQEEMVDLKFKLDHLQFRPSREVKKRS